MDDILLKAETQNPESIMLQEKYIVIPSWNCL